MACKLWPLDSDRHPDLRRKIIPYLVESEKVAKIAIYCLSSMYLLLKIKREKLVRRAVIYASCLLGPVLSFFGPQSRYRKEDRTVYNSMLGPQSGQSIHPSLNMPLGLDVKEVLNTGGKFIGETARCMSLLPIKNVRTGIVDIII